MKQSNAKSLKYNSEKIIGFTKYEKLGIMAMLLLIIISPFVLTQFSSYYSFENSGQIGDTIGGITAPFVNLLAAFLVYKSFYAQIKANQQQRKDHDEQIKEIRKEYQFNYIRDLYSLISKDYNENYKVKNKKTSVSSLISLVQSYDDPNRWTNHDGLGKFVGRDSNDTIVDKINDELIPHLDLITPLIDKIKIFTKEITNAEIESGLVEYYTLKIEEIIKDSEIWLLLDESVQRIFKKHNILYEFQKYELEYIVKTIRTIKEMDFKVSPY